MARSQTRRPSPRARRRPRRLRGMPAPPPPMVRFDDDDQLDPGSPTSEACREPPPRVSGPDQADANWPPAAARASSRRNTALMPRPRSPHPATPRPCPRPITPSMIGQPIRDRRVVPSDAPFRARVVASGHLIAHLGVVLERLIAMRATRRDEDHDARGRIDAVALPLAVRRRIRTHVDRDIEDEPRGYTAAASTRRAAAPASADRGSSRACRFFDMFVWTLRMSRPCGDELGLVPDAREEPAVVADGLDVEEERAVEAGRAEPHPAMAVEPAPARLATTGSLPEATVATAWSTAGRPRRTARRSGRSRAGA